MSAGWAIAVFCAVLAVDWPVLPGGVRLADALFVVAAAALVAERRPAPLRLVWLDGLVIAYLLGGLPSLLASDDVRVSATEWARQLYLAGVYALVAVAVARGRTGAVAVGVTAGSVALCLLGLGAAAAHAVIPFDAPLLGETMSVPYAGEVFRVRALTASPTMLACLVTIGAPLALGTLWSRRGATLMQRLAAAGLGVQLAAIVLTVSHAVVGVLSAALIVSWRSLRSPLWRYSVAVVVLAVVAVANLTLVAVVRRVNTDEPRNNEAAAFHHSVGTGTVTLAGVGVDYDLMSYFRLKQIAVAAFGERPLTGIGLDRFHRATDAAFARGELPSMYRAADPHSSLLGRLAETGAIGGVTLIALWGGIIVTGLRVMHSSVPHSWIGLAATAGLAGLLVNALNVDIMNFRFFWAEVGLLRGLLYQAELR